MHFDAILCLGILRMYFTEYQIVNEGLAKTQIHHAARNALKRTDILEIQKKIEFYLMKNKDSRKNYEDLL